MKVQTSPLNGKRYLVFACESDAEEWEFLGLPWASFNGFFNAFLLDTED